MIGVSFIIDFIIHIDKYIDILINRFGIFSYFILFLIIFCETGLVLTPFLPGDSLLFVAGAFASKGSFNVFLLFALFLAAAILGDSVNYYIGYYFGEHVFDKWKLFKKEHLEKTKNFYEKHGVKTILFARFIPIVRTFAPFVAGVGKMHYRKFIFYNIFGGLLWISLFLFGGYFFGQLEWVKHNMTILIFMIIFISLIPVIIEYFKHKFRNRH
jgi:membrane-associated protein